MFGGLSNDQTTGNVWVTHEEMESLAATPPTVSQPELAGCWWLLASVVSRQARSKLPLGPQVLNNCCMLIIA